MPWETRVVKRPVWFVPPEAIQLAGEFRARARQIESMIEEIDRCRNNFEVDWEGQSKRLFMDLLAPERARLTALVGWLKDSALILEETRVRVWEKREETIWVPSPHAY